jgi:hypothetical protein
VRRKKVLKDEVGFAALLNNLKILGICCPQNSAALGSCLYAKSTSFFEK